MEVVVRGSNLFLFIYYYIYFLCGSIDGWWLRGWRLLWLIFFSLFFFSLAMGFDFGMSFDWGGGFS